MQFQERPKGTVPSRRGGVREGEPSPNGSVGWSELDNHVGREQELVALRAVVEWELAVDVSRAVVPVAPQLGPEDDVFTGSVV